MSVDHAQHLGGESRSEALRASPRMFESNLLDRFSRVHPIVPVIIYVPAITILFLAGAWYMAPGAVLAYAVGGYLFWTLAEYWLHRVVFHFEPEHGIGRRLHWIIHGVHHDHPNDPLRLVMPPGASIPLAAGFLVLFWAVLPAHAWMVFGATFLAGYLAYDMLHYHVHHHKPTTRLGRRLRELHMRHHFQDHTKGFGVSAPFWDHVFGTAPQARRRH